ncbi:amidohydrolase [Roseomonas alkaliterrae]|uniref:Hippurate hydrolase n=1 Tax=Neoroseomonas alkaliterrae TaxID=1452450 RepID=A0A840XW64_9PROT|nr:M20 aminoacylase family protein [Neoroseomonas alkaliterrae]MBB5688091.1 hippurate hydrolase [Neoroseomonas alkaliterrae]MBR0674963.1 amidohydrolase [Neoroseomonas alkaliterrae]
MTNPVIEGVKAWLPELAAIRQDIHAHPELGMEETRTAALVAKELRALGIEVTEGVGKLGVVGTIRGTRPGNRSVGLRADMDALQITEQTGKPYASRNAGVMHACGHDGHTTMLLGAARWLARNRDFAGTVHLIFQPAEEGRGGARAMIEDGLFERFPCDAVYGLHNAPRMPMGVFGTRPGPALAASDRFIVTFRGTGGHGGSTPHLATDVTVVQAHFVLALQTIIGRNVPALDSAVLSVGSIQGGSPVSPNVMPAELTITGTARSYTAAVRDLLERRIRELAAGLAASYGVTADVTYRRGTPATVNHPEQTEIAFRAARAVVEEKAVTTISPVTGAEDFALMLEARPGAFMFLGAGTGPDGRSPEVHTPLYDFNDEIIPLGVAYWVSVVEQELGGG